MSAEQSQPTDLFEDRKKAAEAKFRQEQAIAFKAAARRAKLLGLWAAGQFGLEGDAASAYAAEMVGTNAIGGENAMRKMVLDDFAARGGALDAADLDRRLTDLMTEAHRQIIADIAAAKLPLS